jgi:hypothetical protein
MKVNLHHAAINLRIATAQPLAAEQRSDGHFRWLFVIPPFSLDTFLQPPFHPATETPGNALPQFRFGFDLLSRRLLFQVWLF